MAVDEELPRLECGRTLEQVWQGIGRPPDPHEQACDYCRDARQRLTLLDRAVDSVHQIASDSDQPGTRVKSAIMDIARSEIRQGRRIPLETSATTPAELAITERALIDVVTRAGDQVAAARIRHVHVDSLPGPAVGGDDDPTQPSTIELVITVSLHRDAVVDEVADLLREQISGAVALQVGIVVGRIDVTVEDIYER